LAARSKRRIAEIVFERFDLKRDGRLGEEKVFRRLAEIQMFSNVRTKPLCSGCGPYANGMEWRGAVEVRRSWVERRGDNAARLEAGRSAKPRCWSTYSGPPKGGLE
jgi:hypothetical protein